MTKAELEKELRRTEEVRDAWCGEYVRVRDGLAALVMKLDEIHADLDFKVAWSFYAAHGMQYRGPTWVAELASARGAVEGFIKGRHCRSLAK